MSIGDSRGPTLVVLAGGLAKRYGGCKPLAPVGLHGEAVIDLTVSDALSSGFGEVVMVLGPQTASAIEYHVHRCWPSWVQVAFTVQQVPLGTAHAVLCARDFVPDGPFAVVNSDDVYGTDALGLLVHQLGGSGSSPPDEQALVAFSLKDTIVSDKPVTRGTCVVAQDGLLSAIVERRKVSFRDGSARADDGLEPEELDPDTPVSVNLWGFTSAMWPVLEEAVLTVHHGISPDGSVHDREGLKGDAEVLLPEVVGQQVAQHATRLDAASSVRVLSAPGRCLGVTHPEDLPIVKSELAAMVGQGIRPETLWETTRGGGAGAAP